MLDILKFNPILPGESVLPDKMNLFIPTTSPLALSKGPPEFPVLILVSVWIYFEGSAVLDANDFSDLGLISPSINFGGALVYNADPTTMTVYADTTYVINYTGGIMPDIDYVNIAENLVTRNVTSEKYIP